jgi:DNA-binding protein YbaB
MPGDPLEALGQLLGEADAARERTRAAAARTADARGSDSTGAVTATLDGDGHVSAVQVAGGWRRWLDPQELGDAVRESVQAAAVARLAAWGEAYADDSAPSSDVARAASPVHDDFAEQLREASTARMSSADGRAALLELLAMAEAVERGLDEVSARLRSTIDATHTGRSTDRHVTVTVTGGGEVTEVRFDRGWLRDAHEINIGRQTMSALSSRSSAERSGPVLGQQLHVAAGHVRGDPTEDGHPAERGHHRLHRPRRGAGQGRRRVRVERRTGRDAAEGGVGRP